MTRPNITPGPWSNNADTVYMGQKSAFFAVCFPWNNPQSVANATAIAAVPALLEALEHALPGLESDLLYCERNPFSNPQTQEGIISHKRNRIAKARAALTAAGYQF